MTLDEYQAMIATEETYTPRPRTYLLWNTEAADIARHECQMAIRSLAIQIIARDRRIADALVKADRRTGERRKADQYTTQREVRESKGAW
jgi:hypothetical protein